MTSEACLLAQPSSQNDVISQQFSQPQDTNGEGGGGGGGGGVGEGAGEGERRSLRQNVRQLTMDEKLARHKF